MERAEPFGWEEVDIVATAKDSFNDEGWVKVRVGSVKLEMRCRCRCRFRAPLVWT
jgi:uncharacterized protein YcbX